MYAAPSRTVPPAWKLDIASPSAGREEPLVELVAEHRSSACVVDEASAVEAEERLFAHLGVPAKDAPERGQQLCALGEAPADPVEERLKNGVVLIEKRVERRSLPRAFHHREARQERVPSDKLFKPRHVVALPGKP